MILLLAGCFQGAVVPSDTGEPLACDTMARSSVTVNVTDTRGRALEDATVTWSLDGVDQGACDSFPGGSWACGYEREGHIVVTVAAAGYEERSEDVDIAMGECHVEGVVLDVALSPAGCSAGLCELTVTDIALGTSNPSDPHAISATVGTDGSVAVEDHHFTDGCCPEVAVTATLDVGTGIVLPTYELTNDYCECYTGLSLTYTLSGLPSGSFTLRSGNAETAIVVP